MTTAQKEPSQKYYTTYTHKYVYILYLKNLIHKYSKIVLNLELQIEKKKKELTTIHHPCASIRYSQLKEENKKQKAKNKKQKKKKKQLQPCASKVTSNM